MSSRSTLSWIGVPLLVSAFATAVPAFADDADDPPPARAKCHGAEHARRGHYDPVAFAQHRLDKLKSQLGITEDQEAQWTGFSRTVLAQMGEVAAARQAMQHPPATAPERIDRAVMLMKQRTAAFETIAQAAKELYANLTPQQRKIADRKLLSFHHKQRA